MMRSIVASITAALALTLAGCSADTGPQVGSQTNWLRRCDSAVECDGYFDCVCGTCTALCESDFACEGLPNATCAPANNEGAVALCGREAAPSGMCLPACVQSCGEGTRCLGGVCVPTDFAEDPDLAEPAGEQPATDDAPEVPEDPGVQLVVDTSLQHQTLVGFGASLAYADDAIVNHANKSALYDLLFADAGLEVIRVRNRYGEAGDAGMLPAREIVQAAARRLGQPPLLFMTSSTPPAEIKANGSRRCGGDPETCTLATLPSGEFDYAGLARFWREALESYAALGLVPDYISIQNNPNWVPGADAPLDACRLLPEEGVLRVTVDGAPVDVAYPGYREALAAVRTAIADLPQTPRLGAPEVTAPDAVDDYVSVLDATQFDALALHLYGIDTTHPDVAPLGMVRDLGSRIGRPVFQTEMRAGGLDTAILIHHSLTSGGVSAYLQNDMVSLGPTGASVALVLMSESGFEPQGPYYALLHYAAHTAPGWVRVEATTNTSELLGSAWAAPDGSALTIVVVNSKMQDTEATLVLPAETRARLPRSQVIRTVFAGSERAAPIGELPSSGVLQLPSSSLTTVALTAE